MFRPVGLTLRASSVRYTALWRPPQIWPVPPRRNWNSYICLIEHAVVISRFSAGFRLHIHALKIGANHDARAGIADQIPPDEVLVAAVEGIGECALNRVCPNEIEKLCRA